METSFTREALLKLINSGYPTATFAKRIGRDASTLYKWLDGSRQISQEVEEEVREELKHMKEMWMNEIIF